MADRSAFKRDQIVSNRMTGASVTKTTELRGVSRGAVSKLMKAFEEEGKTTPMKQNSGRKRKLFARKRRILTWIIWKDHKNMAPNIMAELNDRLENPFSSKAVRRELPKAEFYGRAAIRKPYWNKFVWNFLVFP